MRLMNIEYAKIIFKDRQNSLICVSAMLTIQKGVALLTELDLFRNTTLRLQEICSWKNYHRNKF